MGLLDEMADAIRAENERPEGWVTAREFADRAGLCYATAKIKLDEMVKNGQINSRTCRSGRVPVRIYG